MRFYEALSELNTNTENRMFTVVDGPCAGEKLIASSGRELWRSSDSGFMAAHRDDVLNAENGLLTSIADTRVFAELLGNQKEMVICGAGHVSMPVIDTAKMLGFRVTVIDDREEFAQNARDRGADEVLCMDFEEALSMVQSSIDTYFVILTRGHRHDADCLLMAAKKPHAYLGMIGSRRKVSMVKDVLAKEGIPQAVIDSVHMPTGMEIGAETPEEIAVAILAEIIKEKNRTHKNQGFPQDITEALMRDPREPAVLATIVSKQGSSPRAAGTRMLTGSDGIIAGTIGGGLAEARAIERSKALLDFCKEEHKKECPCTALLKVDMTGKDIEDEGMICGGMIEVLLELV